MYHSQFTVHDSVLRWLNVTLYNRPSIDEASKDWVI